MHKGVTTKNTKGSKNKAYPKYKPSGVDWLGDVPEHWGSISLKWVSVRYSGGTPDKSIQEYWEDGTIPWLNSGAVNDDYIAEPSEYITKEAFQNSSAKWIPKDAIVIALAGQGKTKGMVGQLGFRTTCNQSMAAIVVDKRLNPRMLYWWLTKNYINIRNLAGGEARDGLNLDLIGSIPVPLPSLPEQQAIAAFLDRETGRIDSLIAKKQRLLELLAEQRTALISRAVTKGLYPKVKLKPSGVEWLGDVPEHWETWKLAHGFDQIGSGTTPPSDEIEWYDGTIPWITTSELRENLITTTEKTVTREAVQRFSALKVFSEGSLAIAMYGATIGRLGILGIEATTNQACCVMSGGQVFAIPFVYYWMQAFKDSIILLASGGGQPNISQDKIDGFVKSPNL
ncbi:MAG: restriction endonuclease subunit S [Patescibacteria group bacterium]